MDAHSDIVEVHVRSFFRGHRVSAKSWKRGPLCGEGTSFRVLEVAPGPVSGLWNYVSVGAANLPSKAGDPLEFVLAMESSSDRGIELITMVAWYHGKESLGVGHTIPVGEQWLSGSTCDHLLVCLPYPFGPGLEAIRDSRERARILWILPITKAERDFKVSRGLEALESIFDSRAIRFWDVKRASVVESNAG